MRRLLLLSLLIAPIAAAQSTDKPLALCYRIERTINTIANFTTTQCAPSGGSKRGTISFVVITSKPVFATETAKKAWLLVAVAAVGDALNKDPAAKGDELWLSDATNTKRHVAWIMPTRVAQSLQRRIKRNEITLDQMYAEIGKNLKRRNVK